jgi:hypothetical protein
MSKYGWLSWEDNFIRRHYGRMTTATIARTLTDYIAVQVGDPNAVRKVSEVEARAAELSVAGVRGAPVGVGLSVNPRHLATLVDKPVSVLELAADPDVVKLFQLLVRPDPNKLQTALQLIETQLKTLQEVP